METDASLDSTAFMAAKVIAAWAILAFGWVTLSNVALVVTIMFTTLQIYKTVRELRRQYRAERIAEQAAATSAAVVTALHLDPAVNITQGAVPVTPPTP